MKENIIKLLNSNNREDIIFGLELCKLHDLFDEVNKELKLTALSIEQWQTTIFSNEELSRKWCFSLYHHNVLYRNPIWNDVDVKGIIYFK